jgi:hypothetical protein
MPESRGAGATPHNVVTLIETSAMRTASAKARLVIMSVTAVSALVGAIVLTPWWGPLWGLVVGGAAGFALGLVAGAVVAVWPVLRVLWHWSAEITFALGLVAGSTWLSTHTAAFVAAVLLPLSAAVALAMPPVRRFVRAWVWCAIMRHRLRLSFAAFLRSRNRIHIRGAQPLILLARPTPAGERVWVWLRPGLDLEELENNTTKLAVACWASTVRVACTSQRHAALVRIDVSRRDPLTRLVTSPLVELVPDAPTRPVPADGDAAGGLDLDQVPEPVLNTGPAPRQRGGR